MSDYCYLHWNVTNQIHFVRVIRVIRVSKVITVIMVISVIIIIMVIREGKSSPRMERVPASMDRVPHGGKTQLPPQEVREFPKEGQSSPKDGQSSPKARQSVDLRR